jgi:hypothetical protein
MSRSSRRLTPIKTEKGLHNVPCTARVAVRRWKSLLGRPDQSVLIVMNTNAGLAKTLMASLHRVVLCSKVVHTVAKLPGQRNNLRLKLGTGIRIP